MYLSELLNPTTLIQASFHTVPKLRDLLEYVYAGLWEYVFNRSVLCEE